MNPTVPSTDYLAGLFDGEGSINITPRYSNDARRGRLYLQIAVGNTDQRACHFYRKTFGGAVYLNQKATDRHLAYYIWTLGHTKAANALRVMLPLLRLKKRQAQVALAFAANMAANGVGKRIREKDAAFRHRCRDRLIAMHGYGSRVKRSSGSGVGDVKPATLLAQSQELQIERNVDP